MVVFCFTMLIIIIFYVDYPLGRKFVTWRENPSRKKSSGGRCSPDCFSITHGHAIDMIRTRKVRHRDAALELVYRLAMCPRHHKYSNACALVGWLAG